MHSLPLCPLQSHQFIYWEDKLDPQPNIVQDYWHSLQGTLVISDWLEILPPRFRVIAKGERGLPPLSKGSNACLRRQLRQCPTNHGQIRAWYCSIICQRADWKVHTGLCSAEKLLEHVRNRKILSAAAKLLQEMFMPQARIHLASMCTMLKDVMQRYVYARQLITDREALSYFRDGLLGPRKRDRGCYHLDVAAMPMW